MPIELKKYKHKCKIINGGKPIFIPESDPKNSKGEIDILFINERPGPKTKETDKVSFDNPDPSAKLFKCLFCKTFGLRYRRRIFITNAIIWVPEDIRPRNYTPTRKDLQNKGNLEILRDQIKRINPKIIVSLGGSALYSLKCIYGESKEIRRYRLQSQHLIEDTQIPIYPVYHTSALAQKTRKKKQQEKDWLKMKKEIKKFIKIK